MEKRVAKRVAAPTQRRGRQRRRLAGAARARARLLRARLARGLAVGPVAAPRERAGRARAAGARKPALQREDRKTGDDPGGEARRRSGLAALSPRPAAPRGLLPARR